jgi:prolyl-tRNA synthetase
MATGKDPKAFEAANQLVSQLEQHNVEVIYDDRLKVSPGVKFKDAELIGVPLIAVAGRDTVNNGTIEIRRRDGSQSEAVPVNNAADAVLRRLNALYAEDAVQEPA